MFNSRLVHSGQVLLEEAEKSFSNGYQSRGISFLDDCVTLLSNGLKTLKNATEQPAKKEVPTQEDEKPAALTEHPVDLAVSLAEETSAEPPSAPGQATAEPESKPGSGVVSKPAQSESKGDAGVVSEPEKSQNRDGSGEV